MSRSLIATGIGGQGIQLVGEVLARAAGHDGRYAQLFQSYGGLMRGGNTEATVVIDDWPVTAPPVLARTWSALAMHPAHWPVVRERLGPDGVVVANSSVLTNDDLAGVATPVVSVPATELAVEVGDIVLASMVALGALVEVTGLVSSAALAAGLDDALPSYRRDKRELNLEALRVGAQLDGLPQELAWATVAS